MRLLSALDFFCIAFGFSSTFAEEGEPPPTADIDILAETPNQEPPPDTVPAPPPPLPAEEESYGVSTIGDPADPTFDPEFQDVEVIPAEDVVDEKIVDDNDTTSPAVIPADQTNTTLRDESQTRLKFDPRKPKFHDV